MRTVKNQVLILTPEHVRVPFETAGIGTRALAKLIDLVIVGVVVIPVGLLLSTLYTTLSLSTYLNLPSLIVGLFWVMIAFLPILYFTCTEYWWHGQTLGKKIYQLRVITDQGRDPAFSAVFLRNLVQLIDLLPGCYLLGMAAMMIHPKEKRIGDLVAGTLVVQEKQGREKEILFYHTYPSLTESDKKELAQLSLISSELFFILESFLARRMEFRSAIREELAQRLIAKYWPSIQVFQEKEELFLEKIYLYLRENHYVSEQPQLIPGFFLK